MQDPPIHPNVELFRRVVGSDDDAAFWEHAEEGFEVRVPGNSSVSGVHKGREQMRAVRDLEVALSGGTIRREGRVQFADDDQVVALYRVQAERADHDPLDVEAVAVYRLSGGRFSSAQIYLSDQEAFDAFWSDSRDDAPQRADGGPRHAAPRRPVSRTTFAAAALAVLALVVAYQLGAGTRVSRPGRLHSRASVAGTSSGPAAIVIPTHSPVPPRPRSAGPFTGLGTWVDVYDQPIWDAPVAAIASMKAEGVGTLYLQTSNYAKKYDLFRPTAMSALIEEAHKQGIKVVAWYLPGLANIPLDLRRSLAAIDLKTPGGQTFDGFGLDIEAQIVDPPSARSQALLDLSRKIRARAPRFPLGAITPSPVALQTIPNGWPDFPWAGLNQYYDAFVPMDYFASVAHGLTEVQDYVTLSAQIIRGGTGDLSVPIAPIGGIAQAVSADEATGFADAINQANLIGGSLYDFRTTTDPAVWAALGQIGRGPPG